MSNIKRIFIVFFLIALAVAVFFVLRTYDSQNELFVHGTLQKINGNTLSIYGVHGLEQGDIKKIINVKVSDQTIIEKTTYELPVGVNVADIKNLPKETRQVDLFVLGRDFKNNVIEMEIELKTDFLLLAEISAKKIKYGIPKH
ncbi:MAG: hypothetical protein WAX44_00050 [Minisyncoccia bacterium]